MTFQVTVDGVTVSLATMAGETAEDVVAAIAAAINLDPTLMAAGVTASATDTTLTTSEPLEGVVLNDPGLDQTDTTDTSLTLAGTAQGAQLDVTVDGVAVAVPTVLGDALADIASALAAAINTNTTLDICDISGGGSPDVNGNGVPDECEPPPCPWDLDGDGAVGFTDLGALLNDWGTDPGGPPDFDGDGSVGFTDLGVLLTHWGVCP